MNKFIKYATSVVGLATLVACSGGTCAPNDNPVGDLTLAIDAPSQYPAGLPVPIQAQLTMTNTSKVNASNLVYTVPAIGESGNYTGVTITPDAGIGSASGACTNIAAGASCTFIATIGAYAKPGSFIVTATPNSQAAQSSNKTIQANKSLQAGSISVTANLGLVDIPNTNNEYYILPSDQTITANNNESTVVMVSVWVKQASAGLNSLRLVDEAGAALTYVTVGTPSYAINSVNTYRVTIPAGKTLQHIQALSNVCETLNNGDNNYTACSNDADVNLATQGHGILSVQPTQFNLSESYESQVITLTNIGTGNVGSITYPTFSSPFSVVTNNCSSITTLTPGQSCTMTVKYTAGSTAGQITPVFGYDDDNDAATEPKNTAIIIGYAAAIVPDPGPGPGPAPVTPFSILSVTPTSASLTAENSRKVFTITNTPGGSTAGVTIASGWTLPTLSAPLQMESTNCYASSGSVGLGAPVPMVTKALAVGASCTYTIRYLSSASAGSASPAFTYNNGIAAGQVTNVAVDWTIKSSYVYIAGSNVNSVGGNGRTLFKCTVSQVNGLPENCTAQPVTLSPPNDDDFAQLSVQEFNGRTYLYAVAGGGGYVYKCPMDEQGNVSTCTAANYQSDYYTDDNYIAFARTGSKTFVYLNNSDDWYVYYAEVDANGDFGSVSHIDVSYTPAGLAVDSDGTNYWLYLTSSGSGDAGERFDINTTTGEPTSPVASGITNASSVMQISNIDGTKYAYASVGGGSADSVATQCNITNYLFTGCVSTALDTYDTTHYAQYSGLVRNASSYYVYYSLYGGTLGHFGTTNLYSCSIDSANGQITSCTSIDITSWPFNGSPIPQYMTIGGIAGI